MASTPASPSASKPVWPEHPGVIQLRRHGRESFSRPVVCFVSGLALMPGAAGRCGVEAKGVEDGPRFYYLPWFPALTRAPLTCRSANEDEAQPLIAITSCRKGEDV